MLHPRRSVRVEGRISERADQRRLIGRADKFTWEVPGRARGTHGTLETNTHLTSFSRTRSIALGQQVPCQEDARLRLQGCVARFSLVRRDEGRRLVCALNQE